MFNKGDIFVKSTPLMIYLRDGLGEIVTKIDEGTLVLVVGPTDEKMFLVPVLVEGMSGYVSKMSLSDTTWFSEVVK